MKRVMCVWFPSWPIQRLRHARPELRERPLVLHAPASRGQMAVTACSVSAAQQGIVPGMPLAEAKALVASQWSVVRGQESEVRSQRSEVRGQGPGVHFELHDRRADREALRKLAVWCQRFSPLVAVEEAEEPASLLLDITGCAPFFRGEAPLAAKLETAFHRGGYRIATAIAGTIGAAWALAHYGDGEWWSGGVVSGAISDNHTPLTTLPLTTLPLTTHRSTTHHSRILPPGEQAEALRSLPVAALRLSVPVLERLLEFDIRRIEQLLALSRADLNRLDPEVVWRFDQAMGDIPEVIAPEPPEEPVEASWSFEPPTTDRRMMESVLERLLEQVLERMRPRNRGVQRLLCSLRMTAGGLLHIPVGLLQPSVSTSHLLQLLRLHFERLNPLSSKGKKVRSEGEVSAITMRVTAAVPLEAHQEQLFALDSESERWKEFPGLIERLSNRLGEKAVLRPRLWPDHQPEFACRYAPWLREKASEPSAVRPGEPSAVRRRVNARTAVSVHPSSFILHPYRPPCLTAQPIAIPVMSVIPGGPPLRFEWKRQSHVVAHYWGPERIETGWWREQGVRRDYYLVETTAGKRFWLFRTMGDEVWFLHGMFG